ncbi:protein RGF1 INDUCIBLE TRANSCRIPTION FACTOR 1 isoform X1 [Actinidia eriantha]|uniref:protein RGF1 INDUCIBLE TRANSCRIPTION FACTOR 1 isoform X1 n=1 Tax=Actinidia eriantha TaxID=165200 RepID=UPI00258EDEA6|nr:protein RGF1 INDUCIBLE TRANSCRIPTION FACTOR 1 isoform X1 [Actinidia eriantha]
MVGGAPLLTSRVDPTPKVGCKIHLMKRKPDWVTHLTLTKFFGSCVDHEDLRKNEKNMYCIDCHLCFCKHCIASTAHCFHRSLQICKYVYHDVVRLQDIQKYLDCSKIQTYKINGEKAVHLNPRPQSKGPKSSKSKSGVSCEACGRHIQDLPNRFCSIACKVSEISHDNNSDNRISFPIPEFGELSLKENHTSEETITEKVSFSLSFKESSLALSDSSEEAHASMSSVLKPRKKLRKRKGVPRRAPLL